MSVLSELNLTITNVDTPLFAGVVRSVTVPGSEGVMTILAHHEPLVSLLIKGKVILQTVDATEQTFEIPGGVLEVSNNQATILV